MSETILNALVRLFALVSNIQDETVISSREKDIVRAFLSRQLNNELADKYMKMFEEYLDLYNSENIPGGSLKDKKRLSLNAIRILAICEKINEELYQWQKIYVLIQLMDFISFGREITENELDFLQTVGNAFNIPSSEYEDIRIFVMNRASGIVDKNRVLFIDSGKSKNIEGIRHITCENLSGSLSFLHIKNTNTYILRYEGSDDLYLNGQIIFPGQTYMFDRGSSIRGSGINTIYYSEVVSYITESGIDFKVCIEARDVSFRFRNSENGIHKLRLFEESGKLIGIIGGSGVGKSTTLNILSGSLEPQQGEVLINGYKLYDKKNSELLKGVIGFVPQDDLLIEELTVFQNLYYNARMCLGKLSEEEIISTVNKTLADFDLDETKNLRVGNPLQKVISGGQRKRVNIALELMREPTILFADEPTSGLSSVDSEVVMRLLKEQTYKGRLVVVNIHQPSSEIYKMFDRIMIIDRGGYSVFYGDPTEAVVYFKTMTKHANPDEDKCVKCGNVETDNLLQIIEAKVVDEYGKPTPTRKVAPPEWAERFEKTRKDKIPGSGCDKRELPGNKYSIPGLAKQSLVYFIRDSLSKIANKQYILINLLGPPFLAFLLAYFTRHSAGDAYIFRENDNIWAYIFMCVITSMFFGLMISSEEIVKDRRILKREAFLNLSWFSYLNSKIMILFLISVIQTLSFVLIGNSILGIKGMTFEYWLVLFTTACFANMLGLNISSAFRSVIVIYIIIPFILIPQLLFSGVLIKFDKLNISSSSSYEYVPLIGDLMTARWSFEALAVKQFKDNKYERQFFRYDMEESQNNWYASFLVTDLEKKLQECLVYKDSIEFKGEIVDNFGKLHRYIDYLSLLAGTEAGSWKEQLKIETFNTAVKKQASAYLDSLQGYFHSRRNSARLIIDSLKASIINDIGKEGLINLRNNYENSWLNERVLDRDNPEKIYETGNKIVQKYEPGFMKATSKFGRAHFYAPVKKLGSLEIDTYVFNLLLIWLGSLILYIALYFKLLQKGISYSEKL
ncbi:MAG: ATP-binding cassette domain-containing protein [Bacteroidales bacterium]|nr:ATP-binding cassette domain-containing protein [Bacteroidales bacterium]